MTVLPEMAVKNTVTQQLVQKVIIRHINMEK